MSRCHMNEDDTFSATVTAYSKEMEAALGQRRKGMSQAWEDVERGWHELNQCRIDAGITKPFGSQEGMLRLNVGGSHLRFRRCVLDGKKEPSATWALGNLFESVWDDRLPRDSDGRIVLDKSPACVKDLIHSLIESSGAAPGSLPRGETLAPDEMAYLPHVARALGLSAYIPLQGMEVVGGTTILSHCEVGELTATLQGWCPGNPNTMQLLYRASRDDWSPYPFHASCGNNSPNTITLLRVGASASIVGGFSSVPWSPHAYGGDSVMSSLGAFIFMLKDSDMGGPNSFQPVKWSKRDNNGGYDVVVGASRGPFFGRTDLVVNFTYVPVTLQAQPYSYDVPSVPAFPNLNGQTITEIEVFQVNICNAIAGALMEERIALYQAEAELEHAHSKAAVSGRALAAVYGPEVARGAIDTVVELSVRGTRMTTLRSTLRACRESALAALFNEDKWPATDKDVDEQGRRLINCSPAVFQKVLDVLRMRKRAAWAASDRESAHVRVDAADRPAFDSFVNMFFPGFENFITDMVVPQGSARSGQCTS
ncbi:unnamed protein product [Ectocarpus sp. CCAP 1310/34]|nr:unnamed protein product [Ectocarpus sp. CCAP 1310/34]